MFKPKNVHNSKKKFIFVQMENIKKQILEQFEEIKFLPGEDTKLIGYAEMFGVDCIPLYKGINYMPYKSSKEAISKIIIANPKARTMDGYDDCVIGHLKNEDHIILLYDRNKVIKKLIKEYSQDNSGLFKDQDDIEESAWEWYGYNILGSYMDGIPAFAII